MNAPRPRAAPLRVLVNAVHARSGGGITYLCNVLPRLARDSDLEVHCCLHEGQREVLADATAGSRVHAVTFGSGFLGRLWWEQTGLPGLARAVGAQATFSPANFGPLAAPNPVILLRNTPAAAKAETRWARRPYWWALGAVTRLSLVRCRRAIAVSAYARDALSRGLPGPWRHRIAVVHHGVGPPFGPAPPEVRRPDHLLFVGDLYVQKNVRRLLLAFARVAERRPGLRLVVAGRALDAGYANGLRALAREQGIDAAVDWLGHVPAERLAELYRTCAVFVFPSLAETFGNPLVEAMACGAPIASADAAAMPEILGDAAARFDPRDTAAMARCLETLLDDGDLRRDYGRRALARAKAFSWDETARRTAEVLKDAGGLTTTPHACR